MKLHKPIAPKVVRVEIQRNNGKGKGNSKTLSVESECETEVYEYLINLFSKPIQVMPLDKMEQTRVQCFVAEGLKKGSVKSFTLYAITMEMAYDTIINSLEK